MTAADLLSMKLIDGIVPEPAEGAHADPAAAVNALGATLKQALSELAGLSSQEIINQRYHKFRGMGDLFIEARPE
jgi:acetyl-CoA carboxylase carboxyl transferase subunit alpha